MSAQQLDLRPRYGKLTKVCADHGIGKTKAFELSREGLLDTFKIGGHVYVYLESLDALPSKLADPEVKQRLAAARAGEVRAVPTT